MGIKNYSTADAQKLDRIVKRANRMNPDRHHWCDVNDIMHCYAIFWIDAAEDQATFDLLKFGRAA